MTWLQENWIIAVVGLVVAIILLWWLFGRSKADDLAPPVIEPAKPAKPLEPVKPEIVAAEPARFKPIVPAPVPAAKVPPAPTAPVAARLTGCRLTTRPSAIAMRPMCWPSLLPG